VSRPPKSSHSSAKTSTCSGAAAKRDADLLTLAPRAPIRHGRRCRGAVVTKVTTEIELVQDPNPGTIYCDGDAGYPKACYNYQSIVSNYPQYRTITCGYRKVDVKKRPITDVFDAQRNTAAWDPVIGHRCSPDEFPPAVMAEANDGWDILTSMAFKYPAIERLMSAKPDAQQGQMVRYLDEVENRDGGGIFDKCRQPPQIEDVHRTTTEVRGGNGVTTTYSITKIQMTRKEFTLEFPNLPAKADYGLADNEECVPAINGVKYAGYALLNTDNYFNTHSNEVQYQPVWASGPSAVSKRWVDGVGLVVGEGNFTRRATQEELRAELPFEECSDEMCTREMEALQKVVDTLKAEAEKASRPLTSPSEAAVEAPTPAVVEDVVATPARQPESGSGMVIEQPRQTGGAFVEELKL
jgi:chitinase